MSFTSFGGDEQKPHFARTFVRAPRTDVAKDLDPWSDSLLLSEGASDHPPRNRLVLIDVRSKEVRDLGDAKRWPFFLRDNVVARALERPSASLPQPLMRERDGRNGRGSVGSEKD